jgi:hypothetical protein
VTDELSATAEQLRKATREAQGLPEQLTSDEPFVLVASLLRKERDAAAA